MSCSRTQQRVSGASIYLFQINEIDIFQPAACADPEGAGGLDPSLKKSQKFVVLSNTGQASKTSQSYQARIQCWAIIGRPAKRHIKWYFAGGQ